MGIFSRKTSIFDPTTAAHVTNTYQLQGRPIVCPQCGQNQFDIGTALLNTPGMTFFGLDWANRTATVLACRQCGHIGWFLHEPQEIK